MGQVTNANAVVVTASSGEYLIDVIDFISVARIVVERTPFTADGSLERIYLTIEGVGEISREVKAG